MTIPYVSGGVTYQLAQATTGEGDKAAGISVALPTNGNHAKTADITSLSTAITGALAPQGGLGVAIQGTVAVTQSGTWTVGLASGATVALLGGNTVALKVDGSATTQPISGTVTVGALPALAAGTNAIGSVTVTTLPALPTGANTIGTVNLGTLNGAATATLQTTGNTTLSSILTALGTPAQAGGTVNTVVQATSTSRSGTIAAGGTAQQLMPSNVSRRGFVLQNQSSGDLYINGLTTATTDQNSLKIPAGGYYETPVHHVGTGVISIIGSTTGQQFYSREF